jgi:hypothetical protein
MQQAQFERPPELAVPEAFVFLVIKLQPFIQTLDVGKDNVHKINDLRFRIRWMCGRLLRGPLL